MRTARGGPLRVLLAFAALTAIGIAARPTAAADARGALNEANAALSRQPPDRAAARAALARASSDADDTEVAAEAFFLLGQLDEDDLAFDKAIADDEASVAAAPQGRWAPRTRDRVAWLRARSEGGFAPLEKLERVRRSPVLADDPASIEGLSREADAFPPGTVRVEARMLVAEAWLGRLHRPDAAIAELRAVADDARADALTVRLAERELVDALSTSGRIDEAAAEARAHADRLDTTFVAQVSRLVVRRAVRYGAIGVLVAFAALASAELGRAARLRPIGSAGAELRKMAPVAVLFVAFVAVGGGLLASSYESASASPFLGLGAAVLPLLL